MQGIGCGKNPRPLAIAAAEAIKAGDRLSQVLAHGLCDRAGNHIRATGGRKRRRCESDRPVSAPLAETAIRAGPATAAMLFEPAMRRNVQRCRFWELAFLKETEQEDQALRNIVRRVFRKAGRTLALQLVPRTASHAALVRASGLSRS